MEKHGMVGTCLSDAKKCHNDAKIKSAVIFPADFHVKVSMRPDQRICGSGVDFREKFARGHPLSILILLP